MTRNFGVLASVLLTLSFVGYACTSGEVVDGPATGSGNATGQAGTTGAGNAIGSAGTQGQGNTTGQAGKGGTTGSGNVTGTAGKGGTTGSGNTVGTAGTTGAGNTVGTAGTTGAGNTVGTAGTTGAGNTVGTAGTTGSAGSIGTTCPTSFDAASNGFVRAPGPNGSCWHGYAFAGGDAGSTITPKDFATCGMPCMLKMSGTVGAAVAPSYAGVAYIGFNVGQDASSTTPGTVVPKGSSVTATFTATTGGLPLRLQLVGDAAGSTFWCYTIASPAAGSVTVPYAMFNSKCWDGSGTAYSPTTPITSIQLVVPGGATATTGMSVTLTSVKDSP